MGELFGLDLTPVVGTDKRAVITEQLRDRMADPDGFERRLLYLYEHMEETAVDEVEIVRPNHRILERYSAPVHADAGQLLGRIEVYSDVTEVRALQRSKDEFLSLESHELRTPVTSIKGFAQLLQRRARRQQASETTITAYATIERQASRMQELIDLLLDLTRLDTGRLRLQVTDVNLTDLVSRMAEMVQMTTESHSIEVELPAQPVWVEGDEHRLEQVLMNLLTNAVRYSPRSTPVVVALTDSGAEARVSVVDRGVGIAPDAWTRVFERFYRAENDSQSTGMGVGLYITKGIVERHGGSIEVYSEMGKGSTFTVHLPRRLPCQRDP
jgi:signal transduction histidine kinase